MRVVARGLFAIVVVAFAGCGGGSSSTSTSESTSTSSHPDTVAVPPQAVRKPKAKDESVPAPRPASDHVLTDPRPLPNEGTKAVAPGVPVARGGDNSIQTYGVEAGSRDRLEVAAVVKAYLGAQAGGRWTAACSDLFAPARKKLEALAEASPSLEGTGCAGAMGAVAGERPRAIRQEAANIQVLSLRLQGTQAFVIYRDGAGKPMNLPLVREGGEWKLDALAGIGLVL